MALAGWLFGIGELYCIALAALVLVSAARVWVDARKWHLQVSRFVHPARVTAGQEARVELAVRNPNPRSSSPVEARDPFDGGRRWARFAIAPVPAGEVRRSSYRLPSTCRGVYRLGPLELRLFDPLGLACSVQQTAADTSLTVHPVYEIVPVTGLSVHRDEDRRQPQPVIGKGGNEFYMLREYVPGDDLRHVHWPSTARQDDLVIRQPENLRRGRLTIAVDLRAGIQDDQTVEVVLSAVATLAISSLRSGMQVRVVTTGGWDSGHGTGRDHGPALLDGLAAASLHRPRPGAAPFRLAGGQEPVVVMTTDRVSDADLQAAFGISGPTNTTLVVFDMAGRGAGGGATPGGGGSGQVRRPGSRRLVPVPVGGSFATSWASYTQSRWAR